MLRLNRSDYPRVHDHQYHACRMYVRKGDKYCGRAHHSAHRDGAALTWDVCQHSDCNVSFMPVLRRYM